MRRFKCFSCGYEWEVPHGVPRPMRCPRCGSINIHSPGPHRYQRGKKRKFQR